MTSYPRNFGAMLHAFLDGWKPNQETIDFQHMDKRVDPETGRKTTIHGPWVPCKSLRDLIRLAQVWPIWDNYITVQRFQWLAMNSSLTESRSPDGGDVRATVDGSSLR